jgi:peptidoglycan L-alanyl-D-glutamate endopeptidase CwlK
MGLEIFKYLLPSQQKRVEEELALLKEKKLEQDATRFNDEEKKYLEAQDIQKLAFLHPIPRILVVRTIIRAKEDFKLRLGVHSAYRSFEEQAALYAKGRDDHGKIINPKEVVTYAKPGSSWHNYGLAVDLVMDGSPKPGLQWTWQDFVDSNGDKINDWKQLGEIGESFLLAWGGRWTKPVDTPHFQYIRGLRDIEMAKDLYDSGGLDAVWKVII